MPAQLPPYNPNPERPVDQLARWYMTFLKVGLIIFLAMIPCAVILACFSTLVFMLPFLATIPFLSSLVKLLNDPVFTQNPFK